MNAVKFKLQELKNSHIRYEVIYKNLVRDIRKYFSKDFNELTNFIKRKRKHDSNFYYECLVQYVSHKLENHRNFFGIPIETLVFHLGSLIYPKEMLRSIGKDSESKSEVIKIYNYLYKFSLERLQKLIDNASLILLIIQYLLVNGYKRIIDSHNMQKYRNAYLEAFQVLMS